MKIIPIALTAICLLALTACGSENAATPAAEPAIPPTAPTVVPPPAAPTPPVPSQPAAMTDADAKRMIELLEQIERGVRKNTEATEALAAELSELAVTAEPTAQPESAAQAAPEIPPYTGDICDRSVTMQKKLIAKLGVRLCTAIKNQELHRIEHLEIEFRGEFYPNDFDGMTNLRWLSIYFQEDSDYIENITPLPGNLLENLMKLNILQLRFDSYEYPAESVIHSDKPLVLPPNLEILTIENLDATTIPLAERQNLRSLTAMMHPASLEPAYFEEMNSLEELHLTLTTFRQDEEQGYGRNSAGRDEYDRPIARLPNNLFQGASNLETLIIDTYNLNGCFELSNQTLADLTELKEFQVDTYYLRKLPSHALSKLASLEKLRLQQWEPSCYQQSERPSEDDRGYRTHEIVVANSDVLLALNDQDGDTYRLTGILDSR